MSFGARIALALILLVLVGGALIVRNGASVASGFQIAPLNLPSAKSEKSFYQEEFINASQDLPFIHVASVTELVDHSLAALWYGGPYEHSPENQIYFAKERDGVWQSPQIIMTSEQVEHDLARPIKCLGNPLMFPNPDGTLRLLFVTIAMGKWSGSQLNTSLSKDGGNSWSRVERLTLSPFFNLSELVRNRPVRTTDGWCVPVYQEFLGKFPELLWLSERNGKISYEKTRISGGCSTLQPSLIPLDARRAIILLRDYTKTKRIFISRSADAGLSWSKPEATNLPNPDSGISGIRLPDGRLLVTFNDATWGRSSLSLALSNDEGRSWKRIAIFENDNEKSFSYPYMMQSSDGIIHVTYSWDGRKVKEVKFNEAWVDGQEAKQP
jgi:predicted neuraminidase